MPDNYNYDLAIIGSGPGGYVAAIRASQLGLKVVVIEKEKPGGVCLNIGCIPTKALIHQAKIFDHIDDLKKLGVKIDTSEFDYSKVFKKSRKAADTLSRGVTYLLKKNNIEYIQAEAKLSGNNEITLSTGNKITAKNIIIATGSRPRELPGFPFDEKLILSSTGALMLEKLPKRVLIIGAGVIGIEFAFIFNSFGVEVHVIELLDRILTMEDGEAVEVLQRLMKRNGVKFSVSTKAVSMEKTENGLKITVETKDGAQSVIEADQILVSVGRIPNSENIGLETAGVKTERGAIVTGDYYETNIPGIYAIGDVINGPLLAHIASKQGEIAAEHIAGHETPAAIDQNAFPSAVYSEPQIGSFGYTEERAIKEGINYKKATFPYRGAGKAIAMEESDGLVKIIYNPETKEILGAHIVGKEASELIHELLLAKTGELLPEDIATTIHAHPTLAEAVMECARAVEGWAIHV